MDQNRTLGDRFLLRLPDGWRVALKIAAARNGRSVNSEIIQRLMPTIASEVEREATTQK